MFGKPFDLGSMHLRLFTAPKKAKKNLKESQNFKTRYKKYESKQKASPFKSIDVKGISNKIKLTIKKGFYTELKESD